MTYSMRQPCIILTCVQCTTVMFTVFNHVDCSETNYVYTTFIRISYTQFYFQAIVEKNRKCFRNNRKVNTIL